MPVSKQNPSVYAGSIKQHVGKGKKGFVPDMAGVPGEIVSLEGLDLPFGRGGCRHSPYDPLLQQLQNAPANSALKFGDPRAKASIYSRSKKLGLKVAFAEHQGALYVKLEGWVKTDGAVAKATRRETIADLLKVAPATGIQLAAKMRAAGDANMDGIMAESILVQMAREGTVIKQEGGNWALAPRKAKA